MNKTNLKNYAPKARLDFIKAVTERANVLGISSAGVVPAEVRGDVALIDGREWPAKVAGQRDELIARIKRHGFEQTMDEVAYTWFNRFAALRYMEIHDYLGHGWRVLSSRDGGLPEILRHASEVTLPGLNPDRAREMQLAGNQDNELYKLLLVAQCNELSRVMPFLFERIDDETELLLPENLLRTDSIVAKLVEQVPEEDWQEIEVIGWLYQFYISEKKDQVIGKVVKSEDIPAATQLFTPNWIVQYLVQNSVGRLWLMANPTSTLASQWTYYIQPAEQTPEVQTHLDALIQTRIREDGETLNPETIKVLDPACGSGHILVVAYDVLKAIYLERGYQPRSIPRLILEKNLFGLDLDDRAGQLAAFALMMKARSDDRRLFGDPPKLNVMSLQESNGLDAIEMATHLAPFGLLRTSVGELVQTFQHAKTFGSLIQIPTPLNEQLPAIARALQEALRHGDLFARQAAEHALPLVWQALVLGLQFDAVVANPPYMGGKLMNPQIKAFTSQFYPNGKTDVFAAFLERGFLWCRSSSFNAMVTMQSWMFLSSFENLRSKLLNEKSLVCLAHMGNGVMGIAFGTAASIFQASGVMGRRSNFLYCGSDDLSPEDKPSWFPPGGREQNMLASDRFLKIPGHPFAYWLGPCSIAAFEKFGSIGDVAKPRQGMSTNDNARFVRRWHEVSLHNFGPGLPSLDAIRTSGRKWFPYNKGGEFRKWYGNAELVVNWANDGEEMKYWLVNNPSDPRTTHWSRRIINTEFYGRAGLTWTFVTSGAFGIRYTDPGFLFDVGGSSIFPGERTLEVLSLLCSKVAWHFLRALNPTINIQAGNIADVPFVDEVSSETRKEIRRIAARSIELSRRDWDSNETSWNFASLPFLPESSSTHSLAASWESWKSVSDARFFELGELEVENNRILISEYGLSDELDPDVEEDKISLGRADRERDCKRLVSYAVGCMMGRYSLDQSGLVFAHAANVGFDPTRYEKNFPADSDGILPLTEERWFEDDAATRLREFVGAAWGTGTLEENLAWLAEKLGGKSGETTDEIIRRYLADKFFKDHLQTYKKRPIYWLFSSGKQGAFQALVYLHRYNQGTLARMRAEYVVPLIAKMVSRLDMLDKDVAAASSAAARTKLQKQIESLRKKQIELLAYDEKLRHYADMRITLDLDDGVKVNYAKFGDLVAESKAITGGSDE